MSALFLPGSARAAPDPSSGEFFGISAPELYSMALDGRFTLRNAALDRIQAAGIDSVRTEIGWRDAAATTAPALDVCHERAASVAPKIRILRAPRCRIADRTPTVRYEVVGGDRVTYSLNRRRNRAASDPLRLRRLSLRHSLALRLRAGDEVLDRARVRFRVVAHRRP